jgi:Arc/MetJ-type ribon-helix-helix transcriptional regulator
MCYVAVGNPAFPCYDKHAEGILGMTIHLSKDQERFVHEAIRAGLYASESDLLADALERLRSQVPLPVRDSPGNEDEFKQQLLRSGLMASLPTPADPASRPFFEPITIEGEPLSETIIRERR